MKENLVSVIMPTYNCGKFIEETIKSVANQTYKNWELIIVDDCSKDNTEEIVNRYVERDSRIKYHRLETNQGAAVARTKAMKMARGSYMAFLDSDDLWKNDKLEKQINFMEENSYNFTCTAYEQIDENNNLLNKIMFVIPKEVQLISITNTTGKTIQIEAQAKKYEQLGYFIAGIKNEGILIDVTSTAGTKTSELVKVTITGNLNY